MKLTDATLASLQCPAGRKDALTFDAAEPGFGVRVTAAGKRVLLFQYRDGGVKRRLRIGTWGEGGLTCAKARKEAERLRGQVNGGSDPVADRRAARVARAAAEAAARAQAEADAFTFAKLVDGWETKGLAGRRPSYARDATARLRKYFAAWQDRPAASVTRSEAIRALDRIEVERGTISARRAMAYARACYGWAIKRNMLEANPFRGIAAPGRENPRDRVLTDAEVGALWRAADTLGLVPGAYVRLLLLTLQRLSEVAGMRWDELADDLGVWTIPAARAKNGKAHLVHIAEPARAILRSLPRVDGNPLVFTSGRGGIGGFAHKKAALEAAMRVEREAVGVEPAAVPNWRFHDFRRTGVTALAHMGIPPHVADKLLNHITGAIQGVAAVYQRAEFLPERKKALEAWAAHVLACAGEQDRPETVVKLRRERVV